MTTTLPEFNAWIDRFMAPSSGEKLMFVGPKMYAILSGRYDPENWPRFRGNAHQRRIKRRHYGRMWIAVGSIEKKHLTREDRIAQIANLRKP